MPKFSTSTWVVIIIAQIAYGFAVFAVTRNHYMSPQPTANLAAAATPAMPAHPARSSFNTSLQPGVNTLPSVADIKSDDPTVILKLAENYFMQKDYNNAITLYERALEIEPDNVELHNELGLSLFYAGQTQRALEVLGEGASKHPDFQRIQLTQGYVLAQTGDRAAATESLKKAIALGPETEVGQEAARMLGEIE